MLLIVLSNHIISWAIESDRQDDIYLNVSNTEIKNGEEFSFTINLANIDVAAFDINIFFNNELFEYVSGPDNTNIVGSKMITSWYDETGGENTKQNCELVKYTFKAKKIGNAYMAIQGEFYNAVGDEIETFTDGIEIIANTEKQTEMIEVSEESQVSNDNAKLEILRLNHEGITPVFSPDITEYYFFTENLDALEITAISENRNSEVNITGNTNLKEGLNTIYIEVVSPNKTNKTEYKIFVTKTKNLELANADLETLAIENVTLEPEFEKDIYQYDATVSNTTETVKILAIPERPNASVEIMGGEGLQFGMNSISIEVLAENGYTRKKYIVNVYRRNEEEQKIIEEEQRANIQKLNAILEEEEKEQENHESNYTIIKNLEENKNWLITWIILVMIVIVITVYRIKKQKMDKNKKSEQ